MPISAALWPSAACSPCLCCCCKQLWGILPSSDCSNNGSVQVSIFCAASIEPACFIWASRLLGSAQLSARNLAACLVVLFAAPASFMAACGAISGNIAAQMELVERTDAAACCLACSTVMQKSLVYTNVHTGYETCTLLQTCSFDRWHLARTDECGNAGVNVHMYGSMRAGL